MEVISSMKRLGDCASWLILSKRKLQVFITCFNSKAEGTLVDKLETAYRRDEKVIRFSDL